MSVKVDIDTAVIDRLLRESPKKADTVVAMAAFHIEARAKASMTGGGSPHVPSVPGSPPHRDTSALFASIHVFSDHPPLTRDVGDGVEYGLHLEWGTRNMAARPFMVPAVEAERKPFLQAFDQIFK